MLEPIWNSMKYTLNTLQMMDIELKFFVGNNPKMLDSNINS